MKRSSVFLIAAIVAVSAIAKEPKHLPPVKQIVLLTDLTADVLDASFLATLEDTAVECKAGTQIPVKYLGHYYPFSVHLVPNFTIQVDQTCYLRFLGKKGYISYDLVNWEKLSAVFDGQPRVTAKVDASAIEVHTVLEEVPEEEECEND
jgi:hypothetical protein